MKRIGLFPGTFDPFTKGHQTVVEKAIGLFDEIVIGIGVNSGKLPYFELVKRVAHIQSLYKNQPAINVKTFEKLTVNFASELGATHIIRGLRDSKDFEYEKAIAHMNWELNSEIDTLFFLTDQKYTAINSTIVREIHKNNGAIDKFVSSHEILL